MFPWQIDPRVLAAATYQLWFPFAIVMKRMTPSAMLGKPFRPLARPPPRKGTDAD